MLELVAFLRLCVVNNLPLAFVAFTVFVVFAAFVAFAVFVVFVAFIMFIVFVAFVVFASFIAFSILQLAVVHDVAHYDILMLLSTNNLISS